MDSVRKKSPRAPSMTLDEAIERVGAAYDRERVHPAPTEVVAKNLGYKSANSGTALSALASLRYYGLLDRPKDGMLAVTRTFEEYRFNPEEGARRELLTRFLRTPPLFAELLDLYANGLPSDANMRYELIQRGFLPSAAEACVSVFRKSVEWVDYFRGISASPTLAPAEHPASASAGSTRRRVLLEEDLAHPAAEPSEVPAGKVEAASRLVSDAMPSIASTNETDAIPVRLSSGRRAWIVVPTRLFDADKVRLKAQIDLLLTEEQETNAP